MKEYWDQRYEAEGLIWGDASSKTAVHALKLFQQYHVKTVLVPGAGYGRNSKLLSTSGFNITGVEFSEVAYRLASDYDQLTTFHLGSVLDMSFLQANYYDAIYCFNVLHLFREHDRKTLIGQCAAKTKSNGLMYFTVFSEQEPTYGQGTMIEKNTFESRPRRPVHYFTEDDLREHFRDFETIELGLMEDPEDHGTGPHTHLLRYIFARLLK